MTDTDKQELAPWDKKQEPRRRFRRWPVEVRTVLGTEGQAHNCTIYDLSPGGARVILSEPMALAEGAEVTLVLEGFGVVPAEVRSCDGTELGLMFLHGEDEEVELARYLVSLQPPRRPQRTKTESDATLSQDEVQSPSTVKDISPTGAGVEVDDTSELSVGDEVILTIEGHGDFVATIRRVDDGGIGVMFAERLKEEPSS